MRRAVFVALLSTLVLQNAPAEDGPGFFERLKMNRMAWLESADAWLHIAPTVAFVNVQDTRMSPLMYSGFGAGIGVDDIVQWPGWIWPTFGRFTISYPWGPSELPGIYQHIRIDGSSLLVRQLPFGIGFGAGVTGGGAFRVYNKLQNSAANSDTIVSLSAAARYDRAVRARNRPATVHLQFTIPLFSFVGRTPEYTLYGFASYWEPPWSFFRVQFEAGLVWQMKRSNENVARVLYTWDFASFDELEGLHSLRSGVHTLALGMGLKRL